MLLIYNRSTDPAFNLALEEYALTARPEEILILWRNDKAVIVGRNQNSAQEIDGDYLEREKISLVRRLSGGGAVYHDLGNINFTMIHAMESGNFGSYGRFTKPVCDFLATLGLSAYYEGRNDILLGGKKISGNAQTAKGGRFMHHGTLLYAVDFDDLAAALRPPDAKIESKGIKSIRSRVTNISDHLADPMPPEQFLLAMYDYFAAHMKGIQTYELSAYDIAQAEALAREKYSSRQWNYGMSPKYNYRRTAKYSCGIVDLRLDVKGGIIEKAAISGDFFGIRDISGLEALLAGIWHEKTAVAAAISSVKIDDYISGITREEFGGLF